MGKKITKSKRSSNEGSIYLAQNGKWRCMLSLGLKEDGTRNRVSRYFDTEKEAKSWRTQQLATVLQYGTESVKNISGLFVPQYHKWLLEYKKNEVLSAHFSALMSNYNNYIKTYFIKMQQKDLTSEAFQKFFKHLERQGVGYETMRKIKCSLRQYFEKEYLNTPMRNPLDSIKITNNNEKNIINPNEILNVEDYKAVPKQVRKQFLEALDKDKYSKFLKPLCYLMYFTGNRVGETLAYQWKDFDFEKRYFLVYKAVSIEYEFDDEGNKIGKAKTIIKTPKTKKGVRPLPLLDVLCEVLQEWYKHRKAQEEMTGISFTAPDDYVFSNNKGELRSRWGANTLLRRFLERNNLVNKGIHFQALRQTFSNSLFADDADEQMITDLLGHTKITTSKQHYNTIEQFDSVKKAAIKFNAKHKPKDPKYCAGNDISFAPDGYLTETDCIAKESKTEAIQSEERSKAKEQTKRPLSELIDELANYPEFKILIGAMAKSQNDMEAE